MTAMTDDELLKRFTDHVRMYSGLGKEKMLEIVKAQFGEREHKWQAYDNGTFCEKCGVLIGDWRDCRG